MKSSLFLLCVVFACHEPPLQQSTPEASVDARTDSIDAPNDSADASVIVEAAAPKSCSDLTAEEKDALERCAMTRIKYALGIRGAITVRIDMNGIDLPTIRSERDIEPNKFRSTIAGDACDQAAKILAPRLPCTWDVHGPFPVWRIKTISPEPR